MSWKSVKYSRDKIPNQPSILHRSVPLSLWDHLCHCELSKDKSKVLKEHILKDLVPRGSDARIAEIQGEHHQWATKLQQAVIDLEGLLA